MPKVWICFLLIFSVSSCRQKPVSLSGDEPVKADAFFAAFKTISLPYYVADTNLAKLSDTTVIGYQVISQFVPDTLLKQLIPKDTKNTRFYPSGKIEKGDETYILTEIKHHKTTSLVTFVFNKEKHYLDYLMLLDGKEDDEYLRSISINREPTFTISREKTTAANQFFYTRNGFAYTKKPEGFIAVINDTNEDLKKLNEIINPIDTLSRKNKWSGDYAVDKKNFISIRDGKNPSRYLFFTHFDKNENKCTGELKGDMLFTAPTKAIYKESGDPCVIDFVFRDNEVEVKEQGSCGNHRGIKCFFDDTYRKKKEPKPVKKTKGKL